MSPARIALLATAFMLSAVTASAGPRSTQAQTLRERLAASSKRVGDRRHELRAARPDAVGRVTIHEVGVSARWRKGGGRSSIGLAKVADGGTTRLAVVVGTERNDNGTDSAGKTLDDGIGIGAMYGHRSAVRHPDESRAAIPLTDRGERLGLAVGVAASLRAETPIGHPKPSKEFEVGVGVGGPQSAAFVRTNRVFRLGSSPIGRADRAEHLIAKAGKALAAADSLSEGIDRDRQLRRAEKLLDRSDKLLAGQASASE